MADFQKAYAITAQNEGKFANNPHDKGGMTYKGISRVYWPKWGGWKYVDGCLAQLVKQPDYGTTAYRNWVEYLNKCLEQINVLQALVLAFYKDNFWKRLGEINSQDLAAFVYDKDVNTGSKGSKWLQEALGVTVDGSIGPKTIAAANAANPVTLLERMEELARSYYIQLAANDPSQKQFLNGWLARV